MPIDKENKPSTYVNFTKEDVDYYLYVFGKEAKAENQCTLHSSKCAQLVAMLKSLKKNGFNKEMQKVKSELSYSVSIHYDIHEKESKYEKLVEKIENRAFSLTSKIKYFDCESSIGGSCFGPYIVLNYHNQEKLLKVVKQLEDYIIKLGGFIL